MYVCALCVMKVVHLFCPIILSEVTCLNVVVLTGLFLMWMFCEFMINLHVAELHYKPVAACAESSECVVVVILLLISMCVCLKEAGAARGHIKQCCWTLLCVNVYTALTAQTYPLCIYANYWPSTLCDWKIFKNSQSHTERYILCLGQFGWIIFHKHLHACARVSSQTNKLVQCFCWGPLSVNWK